MKKLNECLAGEACAVARAGIAGIDLRVELHIDVNDPQSSFYLWHGANKYEEIHVEDIHIEWATEDGWIELSESIESIVESSSKASRPGVPYVVDQTIWHCVQN
jgi:hypothetical protein